jgi:hypothetical protein
MNLRVAGRATSIASPPSASTSCCARCGATAFASDDPVFVRTGQLSPDGTPYRDAPSVLYRFDGTTLDCVGDRTTVAPLDDRRSRWRLPCGGATLTIHTEWDRPRRIVIRCDDARGVYVQRGG